MPTPRSIPAVVLAGSDRRPARLPAAGAGLHPLADYKAVALRVGGRTLVEHLVERLAAAPGLGPVAVAGPAARLGPLGLDAELVDTDGSVAANLRAAIEHHLAGPDGEGPVAIVASDVLPSADELAALRAHYESDAPCALWMPLVRVPEDRRRLGASAWKPTYRLAPVRGSAPLSVLPGHLGVVYPRALRLPLLYRLLDAAYRTRNRSVASRRAGMLRASLAGLLGADARSLARGRAPLVTATVVVNGLALARGVRAERLTVGEVQELVGRMLLRRDAEPAGVRLPLVDQLSLALDVDTEEEARALGAG